MYDNMYNIQKDLKRRFHRPLNLSISRPELTTYIVISVTIGIVIGIIIGALL